MTTFSRTDNVPRNVPKYSHIHSKCAKYPRTFPRIMSVPHNIMRISNRLCPKTSRRTPLKHLQDQTQKKKVKKKTHPESLSTRGMHTLLYHHRLSLRLRFECEVIFHVRLAWGCQSGLVSDSPGARGWRQNRNCPWLHILHQLFTGQSHCSRFVDYLQCPS